MTVQISNEYLVNMDHHLNASQFTDGYKVRPNNLYSTERLLVLNIYDPKGKMLPTVALQVKIATSSNETLKNAIKAITHTYKAKIAAGIDESIEV